MFPAKADNNTVLAVLSLCPEGMRVDTIGLRDGWAPKFYWVGYSLLFSIRKACQKAAGHQGVWYWCFHLQLLLMPTGPSERLCRSMNRSMRSCSASGSHIGSAGSDWLLNHSVKWWCKSTKGEEKRSGRHLCMAEGSDEWRSVHFQI